MTKKLINKVLNDCDYRMIAKSWYVDKDKKCFLFTAYSTNCGSVYRFWIDEKLKVASKQLLSDVCIHDARDITHWFF